MKILILGILARVQRDNKVVIHHFIWEGSHAHLVCTAKDAQSCQEFYGQVKKQLTDAIKRLAGREHLQLWEDRASVIAIETLEDAIDKVAYVYANPSNDNLISTIEEYPGVSSWQSFEDTEGLDTAVCSEHAWIQAPMIPALKNPVVSAKQDAALCEQMLSAAKRRHVLEVYPNQWLSLFIDNPTEAEIQRVRNECQQKLRDCEEANRKRRNREGTKVMGKNRLKSVPLLAKHYPKKHGRKIFAQSQFKEVRLRMIQEMREICALCREAYDAWKRGDFSVPWPPGTFPPPLPPMANCLPG